jgi:hypothetical protein
VEWFFPLYWPPVDAGGPPVDDRADLELDLVLVVYGVLREGSPCGVCGAPLDPVTGVQRSRGVFTPARLVVSARCGGPRRHRHLARVVDDGGDLRMPPLRPV